jgi:hypothetical protein
VTEKKKDKDDFTSSPFSKSDKSSDKQIEKAEKPLDRKLKEFFANRKAVLSPDIPSKPADLKDQQTVKSKETESNKQPNDKDKLKMKEPEKKKKKDKIEFKCPFESGTADLAGFIITISYFIFQSFDYYSNNYKINILEYEKFFTGNFYILNVSSNKNY